jgi:hypothetical protein
MLRNDRDFHTTDIAQDGTGWKLPIPLQVLLWSLLLFSEGMSRIDINRSARKGESYLLF